MGRRLCRTTTISRRSITVNIVQPYARIISIHGDYSDASAGINALRHIEWCGRISHRSEEAQSTVSWERFIKAVVLDHGDWSIVEHVTASVDFLVDRGITHELVRHRLFSFTQASTRFINHVKKMPPEFINPFSEDQANHPAQLEWMSAIEASEQAYRRLIEEGNSPQIARSVFPNALASRIVVTGNLRSFRHLLLMRTTKETHPQFRQVSIPLLKEFQSKIPLLFSDIEPESRQIDNMRKPH